MKKIPGHKGFTLIELLVVISIIGVLSTVAMTSLNSARKRTRDAVRKSDLHQIKVALESYYQEHGQYVAEGTCDSSLGTCAACPCAATDWDYANASLIGLVLRNHSFFQNLPKDPINNSSYYYTYEPDCNQGVCTVPTNRGCCRYILQARLEGGGTYTLNSEND